MEILCKLCRHRFTVKTDVEPVRCPRCRGKVTLPKNKSSKTLYQLGCLNCLKVIRTTQKPPLLCKYCGYQIDTDDGIRLGKFLDGLEQTILNKLLSGSDPSNLVDMIKAEGIVDERAAVFVDLQIQELPFARYENWTKGIPAEQPACCDSCGLKAELKRYRAEWVLNKEAMKRYRDGFGGFSGDFRKPETYTRNAIYFLCPKCRKLPPNKFAGGYPARNGYDRKKFLRD